MEKTPISKSKLLALRKNESLQNGQIISDNEESPQMHCTQEGGELVDVVWDWNSPQAKQKSKRINKRLLPFHSSPKTSLKRHTSNNCIQDIEKLKQELQAFKEEIAIPENEDCLRLSPLQEDEFKNSYDNELHQSKEIDFFDESVDRDLLLLSQQIESEVMAVMSDNKVPSTSSHWTNNINKSTDIKIPAKVNKKENLVVQQSNNTKIKMCETTVPATSVDTVRTNEVCKGKIKNEPPVIKHETKGKVEFHRTQSFEMSHIEYPLELSKKELEEIERKRREALAKRELKRKQESNTSPSKCSFEEIEKKRLQAIAKREEKKQQEIIEKKRQEALKRLEMSRKKNAKLVKSSLTSRLN